MEQRKKMARTKGIEKKGRRRTRLGLPCSYNERYFQVVFVRLARCLGVRLKSTQELLAICLGKRTVHELMSAGTPIFLLNILYFWQDA